MPGLTVTERGHWKSRIAKRIDKRIEAVYAEAPNLKDRIKREGYRKALESLGLQEFQRTLDRIEIEKERLEEEKKVAKRKMLAHLRGVPVEKIEDREIGYSYGSRCCDEVDNAVEARQAVEEERLLAQDERGRQILRFQQEKENLLDTVWLATSTKQIKELWSNVAELLGDDQTPLQRVALDIEPVQDS